MRRPAVRLPPSRRRREDLGSLRPSVAAPPSPGGGHPVVLHKISEVQTHFTPPGQPPEGSGCPAASLRGLSGLRHPQVLPLRHPFKKHPTKSTPFVALPPCTPAAGPARQRRRPRLLQGRRWRGDAPETSAHGVGCAAGSPLRQAGLLAAPPASLRGGRETAPRRGAGRRGARQTSPPAVAARPPTLPPLLPAAPLRVAGMLARCHTTRDGGRSAPPRPTAPGPPSPPLPGRKRRCLPPRLPEGDAAGPGLPPDLAGFTSAPLRPGGEEGGEPSPLRGMGDLLPPRPPSPVR